MADNAKVDDFDMNRVVLFSLVIGVFCLSCGKWSKKEGSYDFPQILQEDTLRVLTLNTSTSYFIYRDQPMGYHYDLISDFCSQHGITPRIIVAENVEEMINMLQKGDGDLIAYNLPVTNEMKDSFLYAGFRQISHQVLVQRVRQVDSMLRDVVELIGKDVTVIDNSKHLNRIENLNSELGGGIIIDRADGDSLVTEDLIRMVSRGDVEYTISDDDLAKFNQTYFRNIDVHLPISFDQRSSWIVRKDSPILADSLNSWFERTKVEPAYLRIEKRYFEEAKGYTEIRQLSVNDNLDLGVISPYDVYFRRYGEQTGIDWRLLASVSYQESTFDSGGSSWAGAAGLMGLMPSTAESLGVDREQLFDPESNIRAGSEYLKKLLGVFSPIDDSKEQLKMALAAYNGGIGHVFDARALAEKYGADPDIWDGNVERYIQLKRLEQYYNDPVCKNGYFRGDETVNYVIDVVDRWEHYVMRVKD
ncbi:MAG: transglycosylase SLT domain-containing protein [Fermentimonas sp.]|nr:transglycosylase SLT domain-containing protein [Fermentimonas sp.]